MKGKPVNLDEIVRDFQVLAAKIGQIFTIRDAEAAGHGHVISRELRARNSTRLKNWQGCRLKHERQMDRVESIINMSLVRLRSARVKKAMPGDIALR